MALFRFRTLWDNHPTIKGDAPLLDKTLYKNQCAINVSAALTRTGVSMNDFHGALSWQPEKPKYAIRAQELADWLVLKSRFLGRSCTKINARNFDKELSHQTGIIFFKNYWGPGRQGDHIDLWNGSHLTDWKSWIRIHFHVSYAGVWEDLEKAESVWFWAIS